MSDLKNRKEMKLFLSLFAKQWKADKTWIKNNMLIYLIKLYFYFRSFAMEITEGNMITLANYLQETLNPDVAKRRKG